MNTTEDELAKIMHLFYAKHELTAAGITYHGLSNSGILELYNTFFGSRYNPRRGGEQKSRRNQSNAMNGDKSEDEATNPRSRDSVDQSTNLGTSGTGDHPTQPGNGVPADQPTHSRNGVPADQPGNAGNSVAVDQSMNPGISDLTSSFSKGKEKDGSHIDNSIDVFNSVPNHLSPLEPASITPRYSAPPYCNKEYNYATQEEKTNHLDNYHFMLKMEKEYYQSLSKHQVRCGNPIRSQVRAVNPNTNLVKSFMGVLTDLSHFKQKNEYQTYIFSVNSNKFEPEPHSSNQPDNLEDNGNDDQVDNVIPSAGNFGLNDLLNLAVVDDPSSELNNWIDKQINPPPQTLQERYQHIPPEEGAGPSRKRSCSPDDKNVKRTKCAETSTARDNVPLLANESRTTPRDEYSTVYIQRSHDSVRVEAGPSNTTMSVPGSSRGSGLNWPRIVCCFYCNHWFEWYPGTTHTCPSPIHSSDSEESKRK